MSADAEPQDRGEDVRSERGEQWAEGGSKVQLQESGQAPSNEMERKDAEALAIREAARNRLTEIRRRERESVRQQQRQERERTLQQQREERDRERAEVARQRDEQRLEQLQRMQRQDAAAERSGTSDQSEEVRQWLERHRQQREEEARRKEELARSRDEQRRNARTRRQESDTSAPRRRRVPSGGTMLHDIATEPAAVPDFASPAMVEKQKEALFELIETADAAFEAKRAASARREWCNPIPKERKVETVQTFLKAFHDENDMEIATCSVCYIKKKPRDLDHVDWRRAIPEEVRTAMAGLLLCGRCFPESEEATSIVPICFTCRAAFDRQRVPDACMGSTMHIGCEHRYPDELRDLTPLEEKLISLNAAYGFITKFNIQRGQLTGPSYRKHVAGHITVFPNDVESLAATILPHSLVSTLDQVHVIWTGVERPMPVDVGKLLSVRPATLRAALRWLMANNPLYKDVAVNENEMNSWTFEAGSDVPRLAYQGMVREQETAEELIRTAPVAPPGDRGQQSTSQGPSVESIFEELTSTSRASIQSEMADGMLSDSMEEAVARETSQRAFELRCSAMFPLDGQSSYEEQDKLDFIRLALQAERRSDCQLDQLEQQVDRAPSMQVLGSTQRPFIRVSRGREFADSLSPDFFPKVFPTCFPYGAGGPQVTERNEGGESTSPLLRDMTLESWVKTVLQRHVRSRNRRVAQGRLKRSAMQRVEGIHHRLTPDRLEEAQKELFDKGRTTDSDVLALMKELSLYGSRHPLSNETRLSMRKKIRSMMIAFGLAAIWFTLNPNDISNPVKLKLAAHRGRDDEAARLLLHALQTSHQVTSLAIHDPLSSTLFFFREISHFFEHYVRVGRSSIYGNVSHYYATVETNDRGALHLHGLLWLDNNVDLGDLVRDMARSGQSQYRSKVRTFVDDVFAETLNENDARQSVEHGRKTTRVEPQLCEDAEWLSKEFESEANFVASRCQVHHHSATCVKYSIKRAIRSGCGKPESQLCRFRAPWKLVPETCFTEDGLLAVKRDHPMVNRYNESMAIGLRHNHDMSLILTRKKGLSLIHYICNYATKLNAPMWKRLALAAELLDLMRQESGGTQQSDNASVLADETKSFLIRVANRVFTSRELSQPEVLGYLLDFETDFTNVRAWSWVHLNSLYWACARYWPALHETLSRLGREPHAENVYFHSDGFKLSYLEAYKYRGPVFQDLCFYDYLCFVALKRRRFCSRSTVLIPFPPTFTPGEDWVQCLRTKSQIAVPVFDGRLTDDFVEHDDDFAGRNAVLHLALFVPWQRFRVESSNDLPGLWRRFEETSSDRVRSYVRSIALLRISAEDARADRKLQGLDEDFEEIVDGHAFGDQAVDEERPDSNGGGGDRTDAYDAFLEAMSTIRRGEIGNLSLGSAVGRLIDEARGVGLNHAGDSAPRRGRQFYTTLQDFQRSPLREAGLLSREEIDAISKVQKKEDADVRANIQGADIITSIGLNDGRSGPIYTLQNATSAVGSAPQIQLEIGPYTTYTSTALALTKRWTLNRLQSMSILLVAAFLDERGTRLHEDEGKQHFQYVGGEGGTGKSRVIHAIKDMFRLKDMAHTLLITGASGNAAALIGGVTLHSAANIGFEGSSGPGRTISEEEKLRWKGKTALVIDEISQVGGATLASVDGRMRQYREDRHRPFGGIPIVLFFGDFFQFDPVLQTSLLLPRPKDYYRQKPESVAKHVEAHKLFLQFTVVVILRQQVRASGCARLRGFLQRLREGQQTEADFQRLCCRLYNQPSQPTFADGLRAITPLNQDRWDLNVAAVVQWARARNRHISIFVARHDIEPGKQLTADDLCKVLRYGDDSQLPTPGMFFYAQGMPVVVTRNQFIGLKLVNGASFLAADIVPDLAIDAIALASDVTLHLGPPLGVVLQSDEIAGLSIPGLPQGMLLLKSKTVAIPESMRGKGGRSKGKPGFRWVRHRTGPLCTPGFAMTDQKSQGKQFSDVLLNLKGVHGSSTATRPSFMSLYVQLSRAETWEGLYIFRQPTRSDFIEPKNVLDGEMREAVHKLERLGDKTERRFEQDHKHEGWFRTWESIVEEAHSTRPSDHEDSSL